MAASYASGDVGETVPVLGLEADDGAVGGFAGSLEEMMRDQAAQDLQGVEWNKYADASGAKSSLSVTIGIPELEALLRAELRELNRIDRNKAAAANRDAERRAADGHSAEEKSKFRRMEIEQLNAAAAQPSLFTIESATLAAAATQPLTPSTLAVGVAAESALRAAAEVPLLITDLTNPSSSNLSR